jgi:hypothetical protein
MKNWWQWWLKWWVWTALTVFIVVVFSEPPRLWFWLVLFIILLLYGYERSLNE